MKYRLLAIACLFGSSVLFTHCGDDNGGADCTAAQFNSEVNDAIDKVNQAGMIYAMDPTTDNCNDFKDAANDYIDAVEDFEDCAGIGISQAEYNQAIDAARQAVNSIPC